MKIPGPQADLPIEIYGFWEGIGRQRSLNWAIQENLEGEGSQLEMTIGSLARVLRLSATAQAKTAA